MKIAVFGWYGHNNAGDERIKYCLNNFLIGLGGIVRVDFFDLHENAIKGKSNNFDNYNLVIIGGGGLILSHYNYHDFILGIGTKVITIGISVETELHGNPKKFAKALLEKSLVFFVRDRGSYEKLFNLDVDRKVKVSTDLTFLEPYVPLNIKYGEKVGINLLAKAFNCPNSKMTFAVLSLLNKVGLNFYPKTVCFQKMIDGLKKYFELVPIPLYCDSQDGLVQDFQKNDINFMKKYFNNIQSYFDDRQIDNCMLFISMRLHGLIFAVQKGVLPITFSIYPKQINFMKEIGLEKAVVDLADSENIRNYISYLLNDEMKIKESMKYFNEKATKTIRVDLLNAINSVF